MADAPAVRGTDNVASSRVVVDMRDAILKLQPEMTPFLVFSKKLGSRTVHNPKFQWLEDEYDPRWATITDVSGIAGGAATEAGIEVDDAAFFKVDNVVRIAATGEVARVTAVDYANDEIDIASVTGDNLTAAAQNSKLLIVGSAHEEGSGKGTQRTRQVDTLWNYTQIFKTDYGVTGTMTQTKLYGGSELSRLRRKMGEQHKLDLERALIFGERGIDNTGSHPKRYTRGALTWIENAGVNTLTTAIGSVDKAAMDSFLKDLFNNGSNGSLKKIVFAGSAIVNLFGSFVDPHYQITNQDKKFGVPMFRYESNHGTLLIVKEPLFDQAYERTGLIVDPKNIKYCPLGNRDTKLMVDMQSNDVDGREEEYITETGLEFQLAETHGLLDLAA